MGEKGLLTKQPSDDAIGLHLNRVLSWVRVRCSRPIGACRPTGWNGRPGSGLKAAGGTSAGASCPAWTVVSTSATGAAAGAGAALVLYQTGAAGAEGPTVFFIRTPAELRCLRCLLQASTRRRQRAEECQLICQLVACLWAGVDGRGAGVSVYGCVAQTSSSWDLLPSG